LVREIGLPKDLLLPPEIKTDAMGTAVQMIFQLKRSIKILLSVSNSNGQFLVQSYLVFGCSFLQAPTSKQAGEERTTFFRKLH